MNTQRLQDHRNQISADVQAFISAGGVIKTLPYGPDVIAQHEMLPSEAEHRAKARKNAGKGTCWKASSKARYQASTRKTA